MHNIKSRIIAIAVVALMIAAVAVIALSGRTIEYPEKEAAEETAYTIGKDTVRLWYTDEALTDYLNYAAVEYSSVNDDVRVVPVLVSGREYLENLSEASMTDEELPDLYITTNDTLEKAYLAGLASAVMTEADLNALFPETALDSVTYQGEEIAYPFFMECSALCYNRTYLEQWGRNVLESEIRARLAEEAKEKGTEEKSEEKKEEKQEEKKEDSAGDNKDEEKEEEKTDEPDPVSEMVTDEDVESYVNSNLPVSLDALLTLSDSYDAPENVDTIFKWAVNDIFYNYFFIGDSMDIGGPDGDDKNIIDIYNEDAIRGLTSYQELNQFFSISTDDVSYEGVIKDFEAGRIVMTIVTTDAVSKFKTATADGEMEFDYRIMPLPDISEDVPARSMSVTDVIAVNGYSSMKDAANDFACYLSTMDARTLYEWTGKVSVLNDADFGDDNEMLQVFRDEYERSVPLPKMLETSNFWVNLEMLFAFVWDGADANEGLKALSEQMKLQVTGEEVTEEMIVIPEEEPEEDEIIEEDVSEDNT